MDQFQPYVSSSGGYDPGDPDDKKASFGRWMQNAMSEYMPRTTKTAGFFGDMIMGQVNDLGNMAKDLWQVGQDTGQRGNARDRGVRPQGAPEAQSDPLDWALLGLGAVGGNAASGMATRANPMRRTLPEWLHVTKRDLGRKNRIGRLGEEMAQDTADHAEVMNEFRRRMAEMKERWGTENSEWAKRVEEMRSQIGRKIGDQYSGPMVGKGPEGARRALDNVGDPVRSYVQSLRMGRTGKQGGAPGTIPSKYTQSELDFLTDELQGELLGRVNHKYNTEDMLRDLFLPEINVAEARDIVRRGTPGNLRRPRGGSNN